MYGGGGEGYGHDGGASQFGGGGFMPSQAAGNAGGTPRKAGGSTSSNALLPVTFRQISKAITADDNLVIDGQTVTNITAVAKVLSKEIRTTDAQFTVDDGTGVVTVKQWIEPDVLEDRDTLAAIQPNTYVRIYGHFRSLNGKVSLQAFSVRPITDHNEITFHYLDCIFVHLSNLKTSDPAAAAAPTPANVPGGGFASYGNQYTAPGSAAGSAGSHSVNDLQSRVQAVFDHPSVARLEVGLTFNEACARITGYSKPQIREAIDFLVNEGHLYSTIDDDHFKSTSV